MRKKNLDEADETFGRCGSAYKKQGGVQVSNILRDHAIVMLFSNLLVDGPKVCGRVSLNPRGLPVCDRLLQPGAG